MCSFSAPPWTSRWYMYTFVERLNILYLFPYSLYCMLRLTCTGLTIPYIPTAQPTRHLPASPPSAGSQREWQGRVVFTIFYRIIHGFIYRVLTALPLCHQVLRLSDLRVRRLRRNRALLMLPPNIPWSFTRLRNRWLRLQRNLYWNHIIRGLHWPEIMSWSTCI